MVALTCSTFPLLFSKLCYLFFASSEEIKKDKPLLHFHYTGNKKGTQECGCLSAFLKFLLFSSLRRHFGIKGMRMMNQRRQRQEERESGKKFLAIDLISLRQENVSALLQILYSVGRT